MRQRHEQEGKKPRFLRNSQIIRVIGWVMLLILMAGCYRSHRSHEDAVDEDAVDEDAIDEEVEEASATDSDRENSSSEEDEKAPTTDSDSDEDFPNRTPCMRETWFVADGLRSRQESAFFFYNENAGLITSYHLAAGDSLPEIRLVKEPIARFLGTAYWNVCEPTTKMEINLLLSDVEEKPFNQTNPPPVTRVEVTVDGSQLIYTNENNEEGSSLWKGQLPTNGNGKNIIYKGFNGQTEVWTDKVFFQQNQLGNLINKIHPNQRKTRYITTVGYKWEGTTKSVDLNFGAGENILSLGVGNNRREISKYNAQGDLVSYRNKAGFENIELECVYDSQGNLLKRKESAWFRPQMDLSSSIVNYEYSYNYVYNKSGDIVSATRSYSKGDHTVLLGLLPFVYIMDPEPFMNFRYELYDSGQIKKIDLGRSAGAFDAMLAYEYNDIGDIILAEYSTVRASGPVVGMRMVNKFDDIGRLLKTEFHELPSGEKTIYEYLYDCRSYQSSEALGQIDDYE